MCRFQGAENSENLAMLVPRFELDTIGVLTADYNRIDNVLGKRL